MKISICTSFIGTLDYFVTKGDLFQRVEPKTSVKNEVSDDIDYYLFTNLNELELVPYVGAHWTIVNVSQKPDSRIENDVQHSRYYKFQLHNYFLRTNCQYDSIIYIDHYLQLNPTVDWNAIAQDALNQASDDNLALVQTFHKDEFNSIYFEAQKIISGCCDSAANINGALDFLYMLDPQIDLQQTILFRENWFFVYCPKHRPTRDHFDVFWEHYMNPKYTTKRDQPLWNFLFLLRKKTSPVTNLVKYLDNPGIKERYKIYYDETKPKSFDRMISIGGDCGVAGGLRNHKFKEFAYPFDWNVTLLPFIIKCFESRFTIFDTVLNNCVKSGNQHFKYNDLIYFYHDNMNVVDESFREKYKKRSARFIELLESDKSLLLIRKFSTDTIKDLMELEKIIETNYPKLNFSILLINNVHETENPSKRIIHKYAERDCFLTLANDVYGVSQEKSYGCVTDTLREYSSVTFPQP